MRSLPEDNLRYPVLLEIGGGKGSGFYFRTDKKAFLVTALHVLYKTEGKKKSFRGTKLKAVSYDKNLSISSPIEFLMDLSKLNIRKNSSKDIVLIEVAKISTSDNKFKLIDGVTRLSAGPFKIVVVPPHNLKRFKDVLVSNDVFILGYPSSLGISKKSQIELNKPLLRKGIIAGINTTNKTIILDCPVYFGNSGGLAIEVEEEPQGTNYRIIGVVSEFIPFVEELRSVQLGYTNLNFENSGYSVVVPIDTILDLTKETPS